MDCKLILISVSVLFSVEVHSFSYNQGNGNQAQWSASRATNPDVYQTGYSSYPKETILQNGYNSQWNPGYNVERKSPGLPSKNVKKNLAAGLWNNERANQPLQIVGKPYPSQGNAYLYNNYAQGYTNYQHVSSVPPSGYNGNLQNLLPSNTNQYSPKISSGDYIPWPKPDAQSSPVHGLKTPAEYSAQSIPVDPVPVSSFNLEYGPIYKDQGTIVPTQSPVFEQLIYDKPYIIIFENGTYEKLNNLDSIVWDEHNRAYLKEPPNVIIAIIEIEGVKNPENDTALEVPYDTGITKIPKDSKEFGVPQINTNPTVQVTTENPMKYYKSEHLMPIQNTLENSIENTPHSSQPEPQINEEKVNNNKDSLAIFTPYGYDNNINPYSNSDNTVFLPETNNYAANTPNKNLNYTAPNGVTYNSFNNTHGTVTYIPSHGGSIPDIPKIKSYRPYPSSSSYPAKTDTITYPVTDRSPNTETHKPYVNYNTVTHSRTYAITDSKSNTVTDETSNNVLYSLQKTVADSLPYKTDIPTSTETYSPPNYDIKLYRQNIKTYKTYNNANTHAKIYPANYNTPNTDIYLSNVSYNTVTQSLSNIVADTKPNTVTDNPSNTVTYNLQETNTDKVLYTTENTPSTVIYNPTYEGGEPYIPNIKNYKPYSDNKDSQTYTASTLNYRSYKPYVDYNTMTNSPPNAVNDTKPITVTDGSQQAYTDRVPYTTDNTPSTVTYSSSYTVTDSTPTTANNAPNSATEGPNDISIYYNPYDSTTFSPIENNTFIYQTTTADYGTYTTPSTCKYTNTETAGNDQTEAALTETPTTASERDVEQSISETDERFEQYDQQPAHKEEPNKNNQEYDTNALSNPNSDLLTSGAPYKKTVQRNGYYRPRYIGPKPNINSNEYGIKKTFNPSSNNPRKGFYNWPPYYRGRVGQNINTYDIKESSNLYEQQNKPQTSNDYLKHAYYGPSLDTNDDNGDTENTNPPSDDTSDVTDSQDNSNSLTDVTNEADIQNGNNGSSVEDYDSNLNTNNDDFNDDGASGTPNQPQDEPQPLHTSNNGTEPLNDYNSDNTGLYGSSTNINDASYNGNNSQNGYEDKQPAYDGSNPNTNDDIADTSNEQDDENETPIDYALNLREPSRLRADLEIDPSKLKKNVDKPVVWFRKDESFWDKVTKGEGDNDSLSVYNKNCKPMLIERLTTVHHFANGTKIVEYVDSIWDSPDAPHPREITAKQVFRVDSDE